MLIKINTSHINNDILPRAPNPNRNDGIKVNFDLALSLLGSSSITKNDDLGLAFFEIWDKSVKMKKSMQNARDLPNGRNDLSRLS